MRALIAALLLTATGAHASVFGGGALGGQGGGSSARAARTSFHPARDGNGVSRLAEEAGPTFGGVAMTLVVDCDNRTDTAGSFPCATGGTFTETGGASITAGFSAPFTEDATNFANGMRATDFDGAGAQTAPSTSTGDLATVTTDLVIMATVNLYNTGAAQTVISKASAGTGPALQVTSGGVLQGLANATTFGTYTLDGKKQWVDVIIMCNRGVANGARLYVEGYDTGSSATCPSAAMSTAVAWTFGATPGSPPAANFIDGKMAFTKIYTCADCMTTTADMDAEALRLNSLLTGVRLASGAVRDPLSDDLRTTPATLEIYRDKDNRVYRHRVAARRHRISRVCRGWDRNGGTRGSCLPINVYVGEDASTNQLQRSESFDNASWVKTNTNVAASIYTPPDEDDFTGDRLRSAGAAAVEQRLRQTTASLSAATLYTISFTVGYDGNSGTATQYAWIRDNTVANTATWFDVKSCKVTTVGTGLHAFADPPQAGSSAFRASALARPLGQNTNGGNLMSFCEISIAVDGTAATHDIDIGVSQADGVLTSTNTLNDTLLALFDAQMEAQVAGRPPSSRIYTVGATATRVADGLRYSIANWPRNGTLSWGVVNRDHHLGDDANVNHSCFVAIAYKDANNFVHLKPTENRTGNGLRGVAQTASTGGGAGIFMEVVNASSSDVTCCGNSPAGQWYTPRTHDTHDGQLHYVRGVYMDNDVRVYADGDPVSGITDTSVTFVDLGSASTTAIDIGYNRTNLLSHPDGIAWVEVFDGDVTPTVGSLQ